MREREWCLMREGESTYKQLHQIGLLKGLIDIVSYKIHREFWSQNLRREMLLLKNKLRLGNFCKHLGVLFISTSGHTAYK